MKTFGNLIKGDVLYQVDVINGFDITELEILSIKETYETSFLRNIIKTNKGDLVFSTTSTFDHNTYKTIFWFADINILNELKTFFDAGVRYNQSQLRKNLGL